MCSLYILEKNHFVSTLCKSYVNKPEKFVEFKWPFSKLDHLTWSKFLNEKINEMNGFIFSHLIISSLHGKCWMLQINGSHATQKWQNWEQNRPVRDVRVPQEGEGFVRSPRTPSPPPLATPLCTLVMRKILFNQFIGTRLYLKKEIGHIF